MVVCCIKVRKLTLWNDIFNTFRLFFHYKLLTSEEISNGAKFTLSWFCFPLTRTRKSEFEFDSQNQEKNGFHVLSGRSALLELRPVKKLKSLRMQFFSVKY